MLERLKTEIEDSQSLLFVTGAGVSRASGIATFRGEDEGAVWANDVMEKGTFRYFLDDPAGSWRWYRRRFGGLVGKQPNAAHIAIARLGEWQHSRGRQWNLVTQNIDCLHEMAGSVDPIKVHGTSDRVRCINLGCRYAQPSGSLSVDRVDFTLFDRDGARESLPTCPTCGGLLRAHVLWFDEYYTAHDDYRYGDIVAGLDHVDTVIFVGTSFAVGVTELIVTHSLQRGVFVASIDPVSAPPSSQICWIKEAAEEVLPQVVESLASPRC